MSPVEAFLAAVLGPAGAAALAPLAKADAGLASYLPARAALAWLQVSDHEETFFLPGTGVPCVLGKTEKGWDGNLDGIRLENASPTHVAAAILHVLDAAPGKPDLRDLDLARLGKTVDALAKAQAKRGGAAGADTGQPAAAIPPQQPEAPSPAQAKQVGQGDAGKPQKKPKLPRPSVKPQALPKAKLSLSESRKPCGVCGQAQFSDGALRGCSCFKALCKSATARPVPGGYEVSFGSGWTRDGILTFVEAVR